MKLLEANKLKEMKLETVGDYIKYHRLEKGWSQMKLAKELGLSEKQGRYLIKDYETRGLYPPKEMSMKLAEVFGLDIKYFYDDYYEFLEVAPEVLRKYREENGLSLKEAAERVGCTYRIWSVWENGNCISRKFFYTFQAVLSDAK